MGTMPKMIQHRMESFRKKQMRLEELTKLGWGDAADYIRERDMKYGTTKLNVLLGVKSQTDRTATSPSLTTFGERMQALDVVPVQSQIPQVTSRPGSSQTRLGSAKPQADSHIVSVMSDAVPDLPQMEIAKPLHTVNIDHRI